MPKNNLTLAILFRRIGPYHLARLKAVAEIFDNLIVLEGSGKDETYEWETVIKDNCFKWITLFPETDAHFVDNRQLAHKTEETLTNQQVKTVVIHGWYEKGALAALLWCRKNKIPAVVMSESQAIDSPRWFLKEWLKRIILRNFSSALCGGRPHEVYLTELGMRGPAIFQGYNIIDNQYFEQNAIRIRKNAPVFREKFDLPKNYFLASNRFIAKKNIPRLLEAYSQYKRKNTSEHWSLILLGDGELRSVIMRIIRVHGLENDVILPGFVQYSDLPVYYGLANCFIHCSTSEQWGLVVNEAMASGLPVLVSKRCGCASDLVKEGENGFTFDPYNIDEICKCLEYISNQKEELTVMGQASNKIIDNWSPKKFARGIEKSVAMAVNTPQKNFPMFDKLIINILLKRSRLFGKNHIRTR